MKYLQTVLEDIQDKYPQMRLTRTGTRGMYHGIGIKNVPSEASSNVAYELAHFGRVKLNEGMFDVVCMFHQPVVSTTQMKAILRDEGVVPERIMPESAQAEQYLREFLAKHRMRWARFNDVPVYHTNPTATV